MLFIKLVLNLDMAREILDLDEVVIMADKAVNALIRLC